VIEGGETFFGDPGFFFQLPDVIAGRGHSLAVKEPKFFTVVRVSYLGCPGDKLGVLAESFDKVLKAVGDDIDLEGLGGKFIQCPLAIKERLFLQAVHLGVRH